MFYDIFIAEKCIEYKHTYFAKNYSITQMSILTDYNFNMRLSRFICHDIFLSFKGYIKFFIWGGGGYNKE